MGYDKISNNLFWSKRIRKKIESINILNVFNNDYGLEFKLKDNLAYKIIYQDETSYDFDLIIITK